MEANSSCSCLAASLLLPSRVSVIMPAHMHKVTAFFNTLILGLSDLGAGPPVPAAYHAAICPWTPTRAPSVQVPTAH